MGGFVSLQSKTFLLLAEVLISVQIAIYLGVTKAHDHYSKSILGRDLSVAVERFQSLIDQNGNPLESGEYLENLQRQMGLNILIFSADSGKKAWGRWPVTSVNTRDDLYKTVLDKVDGRMRYLLKVDDKAWMAETMVFQLSDNQRLKVLLFQETKGVFQSIQDVGLMLKTIFGLGLLLTFGVSFWLFVDSFSLCKN